MQVANVADVKKATGHPNLENRQLPSTDNLVLKHGSLFETFDIHFIAAAASALPLLRFTELSDSVAPLVPTGPRHPGRHTT